jgi:hypothetical protein
MLSPDCANRDPFHGLPYDFPPGHSRFPIDPSKGYSGLSFDPSFSENADTEAVQVVMTKADRSAWRDAMALSLGDLIVVPWVDGKND